MYKCLLLAALLSLSGVTYAQTDGSDIIGTEAPEFRSLTWINTDPISINDLRGKVVLIRFWLVDCPYCYNSAPSLVEFNNEYRKQGLVIIGVHHPKSERTKNIELVKKRAEQFGFKFPVAQDTDWETINAYWLGGRERSFTSSSILIDKEGIIRYVHEGGEYFRSETNKKANTDYKNMNSMIQKLLDE